ncbi:hypothetical protein JW968_05390 [Candidatus Woesearchaeota archaeon]|nr:hypothetical protein [Candidatus Woesearchaeota archaeon]
MKKMYAKAQLKMGENIAILIIFFMLLIFGIVFFTSIQKTNIQVEKEENFVKESIEISQRTSFMPEFQCSSNNIITDACFDILKLEALSVLLSDPESSFYYYDYFGYSNITVHEVYPENRSWNIYERQSSRGLGGWRTQFPLSLYDPKEDAYSFGYLDITVFKR